MSKSTPPIKSRRSKPTRQRGGQEQEEFHAALGLMTESTYVDALETNSMSLEHQSHGRMVGFAIPNQGIEGFNVKDSKSGASRWHVRCVLVEQAGRPVVGGLWFMPAAESRARRLDATKSPAVLPKGGIKATDFRGILSDVRDKTAALVREWDRAGYSMLTVKTAAKLREEIPARGHKADPDFHPKIASRYLDMLDEGRRPAKAIAEELDVPAQRVTTWIHDARKLGWLTRATQGKAGGKPTKKLNDWLKAHPEFKTERPRSPKPSGKPTKLAKKATAKRRTTQKGRKR